MISRIKLPITETVYEVLHFTIGDCLVIRRPKGLDDWDWQQQLKQLGDDVANTFPFPVLVFGVDKSLEEIQHVPEESMEQLGWVRRDRVFAFKDEAHDQVAAKYEELAREYHASVTTEEEE